MNRKPGFPIQNLPSDLRSAIWVFLGWHFAHSDRNGLVGLVNVVNGSVGTVTSQHHTGHCGGPAIATSNKGRYLVWKVFVLYRLFCLFEEILLLQPCRWYDVSQVIDKSLKISDVPQWFEGCRMNYAENLLRHRDDRVAIYGLCEYVELLPLPAVMLR